MSGPSTNPGQPPVWFALEHFAGNYSGFQRLNRVSLANSPVMAMKAYSMDLRVRVLADCDAGLSTAEVAEKQRVSASWVRRLKQR